MDLGGKRAGRGRGGGGGSLVVAFVPLVSVPRRRCLLCHRRLADGFCTGGLVRSAVLCRSWIFVRAGVSVRACLSSLCWAAAKEGGPAMPGRSSRPRRWNRRSVPVPWDGALCAVLKAHRGDGSSRLSGGCCASASTFCCFEEEEGLCGGDAAGVVLCFSAKFSCAVGAPQGSLCSSVVIGVLSVRVQGLVCLYVSLALYCIVT